MVRRVVKVEKRAGEKWVMRAGSGRSGEGSGGVWRGAAAYRKQGVRRARIGGRLRLDAATLGRMLSGLARPIWRRMKLKQDYDMNTLRRVSRP